MDRPAQLGHAAAAGGPAPVALVTGAGRNLGRAIAVELARAGYRVVVNVRSERAQGEAVAAEIAALGGQALVQVADVADEGAVAEMFAAVESALGPVGVLVNNAGPRGEKPIGELTRADWDQVLGAVLTGTFHCCRAAVPAMVAQGWGRIVNVLGAVAHVGQPRRAHLAAAKAGVLGLTRALACELGPAITVNAVSPGALDTAPPAGLDPQLRLRRAAGTPLGRLGDPAEVAALVVYLASPPAAYITGQAIGVNGGEVMLG